MLICAVFILPVMFATQIKTTFNIDESYLLAISQKSYKETRTIQRNGKSVSEELLIPIPVEVIEKIKTLEGNNYQNAKEFVTSLKAIIDYEMLIKMESVLINQARSNNHYWFAVFLIALAAAGHQAWSANLLTLPSDVFPKNAVASVVGIGGMVGAVAGLVADFALGQVLQASGPSGYFFAFLIAGLMYLFALAIVHLLMPKMTPIGDNLKPIK